jgi:hypothetical protein
MTIRYLLDRPASLLRPRWPNRKHRTVVPVPEGRMLSLRGWPCQTIRSIRRMTLRHTLRALEREPSGPRCQSYDFRRRFAARRLWLRRRIGTGLWRLAPPSPIDWGQLVSKKDSTSKVDEEPDRSQRRATGRPCGPEAPPVHVASWTDRGHCTRKYRRILSPSAASDPENDRATTKCSGQVQRRE